MTSRLLLALCLPAIVSAQRADVRIAGGLVHDGRGGAPRVADIYLRGDRVVGVGPGGWSADRTIDARGLIVAPGFIDPHVHADGELGSRDRVRRAAPFAVMQGVTTVITGNDGQGPVDVAGRLAAWQRDSIGVNAAMLVGHGRVRGEVIGPHDRAPTASELSLMASLVDSAMRGGALGLSSGLYYAPGAFANTDEVVALARVAWWHGGLYDTHIRDESSYSTGLLASITEALEIGRRSGIPVNIAHIKALGVDVHGMAPAIIALIREARAAGQQVTADQYPWTASSTGLSAALLPRWAEAGGRDSLLARLGDPGVRDRIRGEMRDNLRRRGGAASLLLTGVSGPDALAAAATGRTLAEFAAATSADPIEAALVILAAGGARVASFNMVEDDIRQLMAEPFVMTSSDGTGGHPRLFGSHARKLRRYVLDQPVITMERMIAASSRQVAEAFDLVDRGCLEPGCFADVIVFDPATIREQATYLEPTLPAVGMRWVFVNGVAVVAEGAMTGALPGRGLARVVR